MLALILILILVAVTIFTALLESFFSPEDLSRMGIHLGYPPTGKVVTRSTHRHTGSRPAQAETGQESPTRPRPQNAG